MYSKKSWGGSVEPAIQIVLEKRGKGDRDMVSLVVFEYLDEEFLGVDNGKGTGERNYICNPDAVKAGQCKKKHEGEFITTTTAANTNTSSHGIYTEAIRLKAAKPIYYPVKRTGYYCVWTVAYAPADLTFTGVVEFRNSYGELPAAQIPKLAFYGGLTIAYAVIGALWAFLYVQHRHDILPVQNYITAIIIFLILEMAITWVFYDYQNRHGANVGSKVLMVLVAVLNAARNSFSFFLLLIVCMGYGVVKLSLGSTMKWVRVLAGAHFVFGVVYAVASLTITPDSAGPLVLLVILPLAATLTTFYVWTLNSLKLTMRELHERKQHVKGLMYRRLGLLLLASIVVIFAFFFWNSFAFAGRGRPDFVPEHWKTRWFVLDGWLNLVYLANIVGVAYLWRPTQNNRRFAMSDELAQDEDGGFEIASIGGSELDEDEEEGDLGRRREADMERGEAFRRSPLEGNRRMDESRHSVEEPIFEVGDGDGWSDGETMSSDEDTKKATGDETKRLTGKKD